MQITAKIIKDSINPNGVRITTVELEYPRFIHSEVMTHRCLVGDTELHFDLPSGSANSEHRLHKMKIENFFEKWENGGKVRSPSAHRNLNLSGISHDAVYSAKQLSEISKLAVSVIRTAVRKSQLQSVNKDKKRSEDYKIIGKDFLDWRASPKVYRQNVRNRLANMKLRAFDIESGKVISTTVTDIWKVGEKQIWQLEAGDYSLQGTSDHPVFTKRGWVEIGDLTNDDEIAIVSNQQNTHTDSTKHKKIEGKWRNKWQAEMREKYSLIQNNKCHSCGDETDLEVHHIKPVFTHPELCFDESNIEVICKACHTNRHKVQGWQKGNPLTMSFEKVTKVVNTQKYETVYDLSVSDKNHNFVANGIVVHNCFSRNSASSRAIPVAKIIEQVENNPAMPIHWGKNQPGMQAKQELSGVQKEEVYESWIASAKEAASRAKIMNMTGAHKQIVNRILEPYQIMKVLVTATEWQNFFHLRDHEDAQPEIKELAVQIKKAMQESVPDKLECGMWHLPYIVTKFEQGEQTYWLDAETEVSLEDAQKVSCSACAQVSYRKLDTSLEKAKEIYKKLVESEPVHASSFEHVACCEDTSGLNLVSELCYGMTHIDTAENVWSGNFRDWVQFRQLLPNHVKQG